METTKDSELDLPTNRKVLEVFREIDKVAQFAHQVRTFLAAPQFLPVAELIRLIVTNPHVRKYQFSIAYFHLTKDLKWELVGEFGPVSFAKFSGMSDLQVCKVRDQAFHYPLEFFSWPAERVGGIVEFDYDNVVGLGIGNAHCEDGLLLFQSEYGFPNPEQIEPYSFLRITSEFIYRAHKRISEDTLSAQHEDQFHDGADGQQPNKLDGVSLTDRQLKILEHISSGLTNDEIAKTMHVSLGTVRVETSRIYDLLGARNRHQAASLAHFLLTK